MSVKKHPYTIGENYFIRTVTYFFTGKLTAVYENELVLTDVSWIAETGRFTQAIADGDYSEIEPYPESREVIIGRAAITDAVKISHPLPRKQK